MIKRWFILLSIPVSLLSGCKDEVSPDQYRVHFNFTQSAGTSELQMNSLQYVNASGNEFSVETLQYLVSRFRLHKENGEIVELDGFQYINIEDPSSLIFSAENKVDQGVYTGISFVFGFNETDNTSGIYPDLNLLNWNWPEMLGGGYHFMKLEGKFIDQQLNETGYATHMGTAREVDGNNTIFHPNHFEISLSKTFTIQSDVTLPVNMDILKWYESPNTWDLNTWGMMIMPNYEAQVALNQNGRDVFSLGDITID